MEACKGKIKVCHVTNVHGAYDSRIFQKECVSLARAGYDVHLVVANAPRDEEKEGVHIWRVPCTVTHRFQRMTKAVKAVCRKARELKADIYHLHDPELLSVALKLKRQGAKVIFDSHEDIFCILADRTWLPAWVRKIIVPFLNRYMIRILKRLDGVISVTPHICEKLAQYNANTVLCTNYPLLTPALERTGDPMSPDLVFAGTIAEFWNHERVLDAIAELDCHYLLAGSGDKFYLEKLKTHPSWHKVRYYGRIDSAEVQELYKQAGIGIAASKYRANLGGNIGSIGCIKIFEFMMAGLPVICTDFVLWKAIMEKEACGICVAPNDTVALTNAIRYLSAHPEEAKRMGGNGRRAAEREYNWRSQEDVLLRLYQTLSH